MQFTLLKLWENRERNRVTMDAYRRLGGGRLALAQSADEFWERLIPEEQLTAKRILLQLVRPGEGLEITSKRVPREQLYRAGEAHDRIGRVLDKFIEVRLLRVTKGETPADDRIEVAHEALVRNWPKLVDWLEEERVTLRQRLQLSTATQQWEALGRDPSLLLSGPLLTEAEEYQDLDKLETAYVQSSLAHQRTMERRRRWRKFGASTMIGLIVVAAIIAFVEWDSIKKVNAERQRANARAIAAAALSNLDIDPERSVLLALQAVSISRTVDNAVMPEMEDALAQAVRTSRLSLTLSDHTESVYGVAFSPDGTRIVTTSLDSTAKVWDAVSGKELLTLSGHADVVYDVAFSPDGTHIATASRDFTAKVWDAASGKELFTLTFSLPLRCSAFRHMPATKADKPRRQTVAL